MEQVDLEKKISQIIKRQVEIEKGTPELSLEKAMKLAERAKAKAEEVGITIVYSVVDKGGNLILLHRMEGSLLGSLEISINKAYTANAFELPTHKLGEQCLPGKPLYGIQNGHNGRVVTFGGGYPYCAGGKIVGAIGVSGGSVEEDMLIAEYSLYYNSKKI